MEKHETSFQFFIGALFILVGMVFASENAFSAMKPANINCQTAFGESTFTISKAKVAFHNDRELGRTRNISSLKSIKKVRTHKTFTGFTKVLYKNGNKHKIHINNTKSFNDSSDYMTIVSPKGHKMTYPLSCSKI